MQQSDLDANFKFLNTTIQQILSAELGQYELVKGSTVTATVPAIRVEPPVLDTQFRMKHLSGIECVISRAVEIDVVGAFNQGQEVYQKYIIQLRQFNPSLSTQLATFKIVNSGIFTILDQPRTTPYTELATGIAYESTIIKISVAGWYQRS